MFLQLCPMLPDSLVKFVFGAVTLLGLILKQTNEQQQQKLQFCLLILLLAFHEDFKNIWKRRNFERPAVQMSSSNVVQMLYELCKETFSAGEAHELEPSQEAIQRLRSLLDTVKPIDLGLDEAAIEEIEQHASRSFYRRVIRRRVPRRSGTGGRWATSVTYVHTPPVTYFHIYQCDSFSMGIFCLPKSAVIPLHDHCGMTVLSKLLYGSMHVTAYDWLDPVTDRDLISEHENSRPPGRPGLRLAELKSHAILEAPCETSVLYPTTGGNIHSFTAVTSCAVLDILTPPYRDDPSYYRPYNGRENKRDVDDGSSVWLEEVEKPDNFILRPRPYPGPVIIDT